MFLVQRTPTSFQVDNLVQLVAWLEESGFKAIRARTSTEHARQPSIGGWSGTAVRWSFCTSQVRFSFRDRKSLKPFGYSQR